MLVSCGGDNLCTPFLYKKKKNLVDKILVHFYFIQMRDSSKKIIGGVALLLIYLSFTDSAFCEQTGEFKDCDHKSVPDNAENDRIWKTKKDLIIRS